MLKDTQVIFLDETTANIAPENENELIQEIQGLNAKKTVIMIAKRLKTERIDNQITVVDHGRIIQQGTHLELIEQVGICSNLVGERH